MTSRTADHAAPTRPGGGAQPGILSALFDSIMQTTEVTKPTVTLRLCDLLSMMSHTINSLQVCQIVRTMHKPDSEGFKAIERIVLRTMASNVSYELNRAYGVPLNELIPAEVVA